MTKMHYAIFQKRPFEKEQEAKKEVQNSISILEKPEAPENKKNKDKHIVSSQK